MAFWEPEQLPPPQKMPRRRPNHGKPSRLGRAVAGVAGLSFAISGMLGVYQAMQDTSGKSSPFTALYALLPAMLLVRYALTGQIKLS
ncbi:MAG TPA: hypothetical protein ENK23_01105 [Sorangium sp.]|nr:hypothetical protein [Sorangium sp.]